MFRGDRTGISESFNNFTLLPWSDTGSGVKSEPLQPCVAAVQLLLSYRHTQLHNKAAKRLTSPALCWQRLIKLYCNQAQTTPATPNTPQQNTRLHVKGCRAPAHARWSRTRSPAQCSRFDLKGGKVCHFCKLKVDTLFKITRHACVETNKPTPGCEGFSAAKSGTRTGSEDPTKGVTDRICERRHGVHWSASLPRIKIDGQPGAVIWADRGQLPCH